MACASTRTPGSWRTPRPGRRDPSGALSVPFQEQYRSCPSCALKTRTVYYRERTVYDRVGGMSVPRTVYIRPGGLRLNAPSGPMGQASTPDSTGLSLFWDGSFLHAVIWASENDYRVRLSSGSVSITFTVYQNVNGDRLGSMDRYRAGRAMVFAPGEIWGRELLPFGGNLYRHEVGHILQQRRLGARYLHEYVKAFIASRGDWCSNWMETEASALGGVPGYYCEWFD